MPLFFFDIGEAEASADLYGTELPSIACARSYALKIASIWISEKASALGEGQPLTIGIRTTSGPVATIIISSTATSADPSA